MGSLACGGQALNEITMAGLGQINVSYSEQEDRLLLRVSTTDADEIRLWLTRRLTFALCAGLDAIADAQLSGMAPNAAPLRDAIKEFHRERVLSEMDFSSPFQSQATSYSLGEAPLLVVGSTLVNGDMTQWGLTLADGRCINLSLPAKLMQGVYKMLTDSIDRAGWRKPPHEQPQPAAAAPNAKVWH